MLQNLGRITDPAVHAKNTLYRKVNRLSQAWILVDGDPNYSPGDKINIFFPQGASNDDLFNYQYAGDWMIERVVMTFGGTFKTRLLLTRNGIDTTKKTTLVQAVNREVT